MRCLPILALLALAAPLPARRDPSLCGTHPLKRQEQMFLHRQASRRTPHLRLRAAATTGVRDAGNIVVMEDRDGIITKRNEFDLDQRTVSFVPVAENAARYSYEVGDP